MSFPIFPVGTTGLVKLIGSEAIFEFACGKEKVLLDNVIESPHEIFCEIIERVVRVENRAR